MKDINLEIEVIQAVGQALGRLPDPDAQVRVLRWINDRFQPGSHDGPTATNGTNDSNLGVDGLTEFFDPPGAEPTAQRETADKDTPGDGGLEALVHGFVADFQKCALEWQGV